MSTPPGLKSEAGPYTTGIQSLTFVSFNMNVYNQGVCIVGLLDLINSPSPAITFLEEHWLIREKLIKLNDFPGYFAFGSCAVSCR